jgi:hypothetical protein
MDRKDFRSLLSKLAGTPNASAPARLLKRVGKAVGATLAGRNNAFEPLEGRMMLEGSFATAVQISLDNGTGRGASIADINTGTNFINSAAPATNNDFYFFDALEDAFVTVLADTANENPASTLNTRIQVFDANQVQVASGTTNGNLTSGVASDGWAGFVATAGQRYYVVVSSDGTGPTTGTYTVRVVARNQSFDVGGETPELGVARELGQNPLPDYAMVLPLPILGQLGGTGLPISSRERQDNIVYKWVVPQGAQWDNFVTINAQSTQGNLSLRLDTRLDIYNASGQLVTSDSDAGRINDAFATLRARPGETYYIRVRSDEIRNANAALATGPFYLVFDAITNVLPINPVTRVGRDTAGGMIGFDQPSTAPNPNMGAPRFQTTSYEFMSQGTGLTIISLTPAGLNPLTDGALRLYDEAGNFVAFNNDFSGPNPQISAQLEGGKRYFLVVDGFELNSGTQYALGIETNVTFNTNNGLDDHADTPAAGDPNDVRRAADLATALIFGPRRALLDADGNVIQDHGQVTTATGQGRTEATGDTDIFQFTPQVSMLNEHDGDNDDAGTALYVGGAFNIANPAEPWPTTSRNLAIWDAADWFFTGAQNVHIPSGTQLGFVDNPDTPGTNRAEIYALYDWDLDPTSDPADGFTDHVLVVGGDFDLNFIDPATGQVVTIKNFAIWIQDPGTGRFGWLSLGDVNGPVRAITAYDPEEFDSNGSPDGGEVDDPNNSEIPQLFIGGQFTSVGGGTPANNIAFFDLVQGGWFAMGTGTNGPVHAFTVYDFGDPGDERAFQAGNPGPPPTPDIRFVADTPDRPRSLIVGGAFSNAGGVNAGNVVAWNGVNFENLGTGRVNATPGNGNGGVPPVINLNGPVFALEVFNSADPDDDGPIGVPAGGILYIGGQFNQVNGAPIGPNLLAFGYTLQIDTPGDIYNPQLFVGNFGLAAGTAAHTVFALEVWDPADLNGNDIPPFLVVGGNLPGVGHIGITDGLGAVQAFNGGTNGIVRAITALTDAQEPDISETITDTPQQVLYLGGDFTQVFDADGNPWDALHVAQFSAHNLGLGDFFEFALPSNTAFPTVSTGVDMTDPTLGAATVFALTSFDDGNPLEWDRHDRRAQRLQIVVSPETPSFLNTRVRVFDSNFNVIYDFDRPGSETISPPFPDPSGMLTGSLAVPPDAPGGGFIVELEGVKVWAGATYYIEISGTGTGRYNFSVTTAAAPEDLNGDGRLDDVNATFDEEPDAGRFSNAFNFKIDTALGTGDGTNYRQSATNPGQAPLNGNNRRTQHVTPSIGDRFIQGFDFGNIHNIDDTDLYSFRAEFTGMVEIRLDTTFLAAEYGEALQGDVGNTFRPDTSLINSRFDGAIRVFRNDFVQIAYNDDNFASRGDFAIQANGQEVFFTTGGTRVGTLGGVFLNEQDPDNPNAVAVAAFQRRDPRVVIPVIAGNFYFVQIESGQKWVDGRPEDPADRTETLPREREARSTHGAYRLMINQMPFQQAEIINGQQVLDDHADNNTNIVTDGDLATPIAIGDDPTDSLTNGRGSITGVIRNTPLNPLDSDLFSFIAPGSGNMAITVRPTGTGNALLPTFALFAYDDNGRLTPVAVATGQPITGGGVGATLQVIAGQKFVLRVIGQGTSQGAYQVDISGIPAVDDHADNLDLTHATEIRLFDFQGIGAASGRIEAAADSDVFKFRVSNFVPFTITVDSESTLNPDVTVYEVSEDLSGNPILLRVGIATGTPGPNNRNVATTTFAVTPGREIVQNGNVVRAYPFYYVVVKGANPISDFGSYNINVNFTPTDDHADGDTDFDGNFDTGEYSLATRIVIDAATGQGGDSGSIEVASDSDLFMFTAAATGPASIVVSRPSTSTLRTRVSILDANAQVIASGLAADDLIAGTAIATLNVARGVTYFVVVEGFEDPLNPNVNTTRTGDYTVSVISPRVDDYPNKDEFTLANAASNIPIVFSTGIGRIGGTAGGDPANPVLEYSGDTDLFTFTTIRAGNVVVTITPFDAAAGRIAARLSIFDANGNFITSVDGGRLEPISITIPNAPTGTRYYALVEAITGVPLTTTTGEYSITVAGPAATGGGPGTTPDAIDFANPNVITLSPRTGDGQRSDTIEVINDRDLFSFSTTAAGKVFVQLAAGNGSLLRASIRVLNAANELVQSEVAFDSDGVPGAIAQVSFDGTALTTYYIVVDGLGDSTGSYTVKVDSTPLVNELVYPEGYASENTREFVSIVNPNNTDVTYTIYLRYETGDLETVVATAIIPANSRSGLTIIDPTYRTPGLRLNTPYAIVINSDKPLGATLAHYDFGNGLGDSFTEKTAATWNFARVEKNAGILDFVIFYNPNDFDVLATLTANVNGVSISHTLTFGANRRGGFAINDIADFPTGVYGATLTVTPVNPANNAAFIGVVASLSHYDLNTGAAAGLLGDATVGATAGVITAVAQGPSIDSEVNFYNPGSSPATVTLTASYIRTALPTFTKTIVVPARTSVRLTGSELGSSPDQPVGIAYRANVPIVASSTQRQNGDNDSTSATTEAATQFFFGDAFIDPRFPGLQVESLFLYNPGNVANNITIRLTYIDGTVDIITRNVPARGFAEVQLHELDEIRTRTEPTWFAIDTFSTIPFVAGMTHYDLALSGGWTTAGVPFGVTTPLSKIV